MTENEAIHKLEYSKKAYQTLIDEKVDSGKLVGDGVRGEWKAETPLNEVYKSMIDALDMAIKALEAQPCEDCISRKQALKETKALIRGDYDPEYIIETLKMLPSVTPKPKTGRWIFHKPFDNGRKNCNECIECSQCHTWFGYAKTPYCPNCGAKMQEVETKIEQGLNFGDQDTMMPAT